MQTKADILSFFSRFQYPPSSNSQGHTGTDTIFKTTRSSLELWELLLSQVRGVSGLFKQGKDGKAEEGLIKYDSEPEHSCLPEVTSIQHTENREQLHCADEQ